MLCAVCYWTLKRRKGPVSRRSRQVLLISLHVVLHALLVPIDLLLATLRPEPRQSVLNERAV